MPYSISSHGALRMTEAYMHTSSLCLNEGLCLVLQSIEYSKFDLVNGNVTVGICEGFDNIS